jgi:hypothetical protein
MGSAGSWAPEIRDKCHATDAIVAPVPIVDAPWGYDGMGVVDWQID